MKKKWLTTLLVGTTLVVGLLGSVGATSTAIALGPTALAEHEIVSSVLKVAETTDLNSLAAIPAERFVLPPAGIDVVRVRMEGVYTVDGVGTDTVELSGWFACIHREARLAPGQTQISWNTAIVDTEFVGFDIRGESKIFGPVHVYLNPDLKSYGQAGALNLPELLQRKPLLVAGDTTTVRPPSPTSPPTDPEKCIAVMNLKIDMPQLGLKMQTKEALRNYSFVETIPPVGTTPSFTLQPTELISEGRVVGSLHNSTSKFREIVIKAPFNGSETASR